MTRGLDCTRNTDLQDPTMRLFVSACAGVFWYLAFAWINDQYIAYASIYIYIYNVSILSFLHPYTI